MESSSSESKKKTKRTQGRRKIEMKRIEKKSTLQVTFSKRRKGLLKKASELSVLCGSEVAILVQSPAQKMFAFGHPSVDSTIPRYLNMNIHVVSSSNDSVSMAKQCFREDYDYDSCLKRLEYTEAFKKLEMEKKALLNDSSNINKQEAGAEVGGGLWFDKSIESMGIDESEEFLEQLKALSDNVQRLLLHKQSLKQIIDLESIVDQPQNILTGIMPLVGDCNAVVNQHETTMQNKLSQESEVVVCGGSLPSSSSNLAARDDDRIELLAGDDDESLDSFTDSLLVDADMFDDIYGSDDDEATMQNKKLSQESEAVVGGGSLSSSSSDLAARDDRIELRAGDDDESLDSFVDSLFLDDEMLDFSKLI